MAVEKLKSAWAKTPHWARLLLAVVAMQALFWMLLKPMVIGTVNPPFSTIQGKDFAEARLEAPTWEAVQKAQFTPIKTMPAWHCCDTGYRAFRYTFDLNGVPKTGLGITPHIRADNYVVYVNGELVASPGRLELPNQTFHNLFRPTHHIAAGILKPTSNQVTFVMVREGIPYFDYFPPVIGEFQHIQNNMESTEYLAGGYSFMVAAAIGMIALFAFIFYVISARDREPFWMFVLAASLAAISFYYVWVDPPFGGHTRVAYFFSISILVQFAWFGWADAWSRKAIRWALPIGLAVFALGLGAALWSLWALPLGPGYDRASDIFSWTGIAFAIATALRLLTSFQDLREDRYLEAAIALLLVSLFALQAITELTQALNMGYVSRTQPFLIIGIAVAFFARRVTLFRSAEQITAMLQTQLEERTVELAAAHDREKRFVRQQALDEERQRIMRDMHDGLGSHLMSLMMMARRGAGKHSDFAEGLQSVIDEMRLMIESMDSVGESLRAALAVFRKRVVPRAQEAGFTVDWNEEDCEPLPSYKPREVLQVFRILQEAVTNSLKHSGGDLISIAISRSAKPGDGICVTIADNGDGIENDAKGESHMGRGLRNMRKRAEAIGAEFDIASSSDGTRVTIELEGRD